MLFSLKVNLKEKFSLALLDIEAIQFGAFRLNKHEENPDLPLSPIYIDMRRIRSFPHVFRMAVELLSRELKGFSFEYIADVPTGVTPLVSALSYKEKIPMISPRKPKTHGTGASIDGAYHSGLRVVLIEDVVTSGKSVEDALSTLRSKGIIVEGVVVLYDREEGGVEMLRSRGYTVRTILSLSEEIYFYRKERKITQANYNAVRNMLAK